MKKTKGFIDVNNQVIKVYHGRKKVGYLYFYEGDKSIHIADLEIVKSERNRGYGKILMNCMMGIASAFKKPLYLFSYLSSIEFYMKLGFLRQIWFKNGEYDGKKVHFTDLDKDVTFESQVSQSDLVWFPPDIKEVYLPVNYI